MFIARSYLVPTVRIGDWMIPRVNQMKYFSKPFVELSKE